MIPSTVVVVVVQCDATLKSFSLRRLWVVEHSLGVSSENSRAARMARVLALNFYAVGSGCSIEWYRYSAIHTGFRKAGEPYRSASEGHCEINATFRLTLRTCFLPGFSSLDALAFLLVRYLEPYLTQTQSQRGTKSPSFTTLFHSPSSTRTSRLKPAPISVLLTVGSTIPPTKSGTPSGQTVQSRQVTSRTLQTIWTRSMLDSSSSCMWFPSSFSWNIKSSESLTFLGLLSQNSRGLEDYIVKLSPCSSPTFQTPRSEY